jgi:hypothetical protein
LTAMMMPGVIHGFRFIFSTATIDKNRTIPKLTCKKKCIGDI